MVKLPLLSSRRLIGALGRLGFYIDHQKGSHIVLKDRATDTITIVVPAHDEIDRGTLRSILKQGGIDLEDLLKVLLTLR